MGARKKFNNPDAIKNSDTTEVVMKWNFEAQLGLLEQSGLRNQIQIAVKLIKRILNQIYDSNQYQ